jgi:hypothetical protein
VIPGHAFRRDHRGPEQRDGVCSGPAVQPDWGALDWVSCSLSKTVCPDPFHSSGVAAVLFGLAKLRIQCLQSEAPKHHSFRESRVRVGVGLAFSCSNEVSFSLFSVRGWPNGRGCRYVWVRVSWAKKNPFGGSEMESESFRLSGLSAHVSLCWATSCKKLRSIGGVEYTDRVDE